MDVRATYPVCFVPSDAAVRTFAFTVLLPVKRQGPQGGVGEPGEGQQKYRNQ
jgi:hypothetical protein